jgi:hypothetical protein
VKEENKMDSHHIKMFIVDGAIYFIHHSVNDPNDDNPAVHLHAPTKDQVRFKAPLDGPFTIEFKAESPFTSGAGAPGAPISSSFTNGVDQTSLFTLKPIATVTKKFPYTATLGGVTIDPELIIDNSGGGGGGPVTKAKKKR